jgi:hypothetical protein
MNASAISFLVWCAIMVIVGVFSVVGSRRSAKKDQELESVAKETLPEIGESACKAHQKAFHRRPGTKDEGPWYEPEPKGLRSHIR